MLSDDVPVNDAWGYEADPRCEDCDQSIVTRFGGLPPVLCPSCEAEWTLLSAAGKVWISS